MTGTKRRDTVEFLKAADGRRVAFVATDLLPGWPLRFWGFVADCGGPGRDILVRLDTLTANDGWTVRQLLAVAQARLAAEYARSGGGAAEALVRCLERAVDAYLEVRTEPPSSLVFEPGEEASPYPWTVARCGGFAIPLCPDPESRGEGLTPEQLLMILDRALSEWFRISPHRRRVWEARHAIREALGIEARRARAPRGEAASAGLSD